MWLHGMIDLDLRVKCSGTNTDSGIWLKTNFGSRVGFGSKVSPYQRIKIDIHFL